MVNPENINVFVNHHKDAKCAGCGKEIIIGDFVTLEIINGKYEASCLKCSKLDHLIYLPSGDAAITRRARKYSTLFAIVYKLSRARKRQERQGLLVEAEALEQAVEESEADYEIRVKRKEINAIRREKEEKEYKELFAARVREIFPKCPKDREYEITEHACEKYSGRVGRTAAAKDLKDWVIIMAVWAHIRHRETNYDELLTRGYDKGDLRHEIKGEIFKIINGWT